MKNYLTEEQKNFIIENYAAMRSKDIVDCLGITYAQMHSYVNNKKLLKNKEVWAFHPNYFEECLEKKNISGYNVYDYLGKNKEPKIQTIELYKSKYGKYSVNQNYFSNIDNEWKAYWLGFLYADGYVIFDDSTSKTKCILGVGLSAKDEGHLFKLKDSLQTDSPIKRFNTNYKNCESSKLTVCNLKIVKDLCQLGCVPNKSLILQFPETFIVPDELIRHFMRGYFDGDGCVSVNKTKRTVHLNVIGTKDFLEEWRKVLFEKIDVPITDIVRSKDSNAFAWQTGNIYAIEKIYKFLYKDCNIWLDRKLNKFDDVFSLA